MSLKNVLIGGMLSLAVASLLVSGYGFTSSVMAEEGSASSDEHGKKDPHARFREGSMMGGMMGEMKSPHSGMSKKGPHGSKKGMHSPFSVQGLKEKLELDEAQTKKIREVISNYRKGSISKSAELKIAQIEFDEAVSEKGFSLSDAEKKAKKRESVATELTMVRVKALAGAREILSDAQYEKFMGMMAHRMSRSGRKGKHGGHGFKSHGGGSGMHGGMMGQSSFGGHGKTEFAGRHHGGSSPHGSTGGKETEGSYDD